jgi:hypothetical protein
MYHVGFKHYLLQYYADHTYDTPLLEMLQLNVMILHVDEKKKDEDVEKEKLHSIGLSLFVLLHDPATSSV